MKIILLISSVIILWQNGCDTKQTPEQQQPPQQQQPKQQPQPRITHKFELVPYTNGDIAIDQTTGQKCRTWDWACGCYSAIFDNYNKKTEKLTPGSAAYVKASEEFTRQLAKCDESPMHGVRCDAIQNLPTCESLK